MRIYTEPWEIEGNRTWMEFERFLGLVANPLENDLKEAIQKELEEAPFVLILKSDIYEDEPSLMKISRIEGAKANLRFLGNDEPKGRAPFYTNCKSYWSAKIEPTSKLWFVEFEYQSNSGESRLKFLLWEHGVNVAGRATANTLKNLREASLTPKMFLWE